MSNRFKDRADAGQQLGALLAPLRGQNVIVLGLPRGGLAVAIEVARELHAPLDALNVRKLGVPWREELAMGAVATGGVRVLNSDVIMALGITKQDLDEATRFRMLELDRRELLYRNGRPAPELRGRIVVLVDDGIATGATVRAAIGVIKAQHPARLVLATPVAQRSVVSELEREVDQLVCVSAPGDLYAIGYWYDRFPQLTDGDVRRMLAEAASASASASVSESVAAPRDAHAAEPHGPAPTIGRKP
jgi:putative phosphoribosyl transferase